MSTHHKCRKIIVSHQSSPITNHQSPITNHQSTINNRQSTIIQLSVITFLFLCVALPESLTLNPKGTSAPCSRALSIGVAMIKAYGAQTRLTRPAESYVLVIVAWLSSIPVLQVINRCFRVMPATFSLSMVKYTTT